MAPEHLTRLPAGRRTKYAMLALWIVIAVIAGPLAVKLTEQTGQ
jgi:RND superfamily putative drug exporter